MTSNDYSSFKIPIPKILAGKINQSNLQRDLSTGPNSSNNSNSAPRHHWPHRKPEFPSHNESTFLGNFYNPACISSTPLVRPPPPQNYSHTQHRDTRRELYNHQGYGIQAPLAVSDWFARQTHNGPSDWSFASRGPNLAYYEEQEARQRANNWPMASSTSQMGLPFGPDQRRLMGPPPVPKGPADSSTMGYFNNSRGTESVCSSAYGSRSVRSVTSDAHDYCDKVMQKAFDLFMERCNLPPEQSRMAVQVVNQLRGFVGEAAAEVSSIQGSVKSHYSRYASSVKSSFSQISEKSREAVLSIYKHGIKATRKTDRNPTNSDSIQCSTKRLSRSIDTRACIKDAVSVNVVERVAPVEKKDRSFSSDCSLELTTPKTVQRKNLATAKGVAECDNPSEKLLTKNVTIRRGKLETQRIRSKIKATAANISDTPPCVKAKSSVIVRKPTKRAKTVLKTTARTSLGECISITTTLEVTRTRSGRSVVKPNYYQGQRPTKSTTELSSSKAQPSRSRKRKAKSDESQTDVECKEPTKKPRKAAAPPPKVPSPPVFYSRSGRIVKPRVFGVATDLNLSSLNSPAMKPRKEIPKKQKEKGHTKKKGSEKENLAVGTLQDDTHDVSDHDFSFDGNEFFVPAVTHSTRRGGAKVKGLGKIGAQTPPLHHFVANLNPQLVSSTTPSQTPEWHLSQRTQSEVKELQKRKVPKKGKNLIKPSVEKLTQKEQKKVAKEQAAVMNFARGVRRQLSPGYPIFNEARYDDSMEEDSDNE